MKAKHWYDYLWVYAIIYFALGFFNILFAWLGMIDFFLPLLLAIFGGNKFFCNHLCGRGQLPAIGFNGIPVALLALSNPIGVIFAALFVAHISVGGAYLPTKYYQPEIADLIVAVIIYLCAFVTLFKGIVANLFKSKKEQKANANADNGKEEKK